MKKRILAIIMSVVFVVSLTACGGGNKPADGKSEDSAPAEAAKTESDSGEAPEEQGKTEAGSEDKVVIKWMPAYLKPDVVKKYADLYNASQEDVYVDIVDAVFGSTVDYYEALAVNIASGDSYDIFSMSATYFDKYVNSGTAYCVDEFITGNADVKDYAQLAVTRNGSAYAFPATNDVIGLFVNLDMLENSGHTIEDLENWDSFVQAAIDISETNGNYGALTNLGFGGGYAEFLWYATMWSAGGDISADLDGKITVTNPDKVAKAAVKYRDLISGDGGSTEFNNDMDYFINQTCGMDIMGQDGLYLTDEGNVDFEWTFVPVPAVDKGGQSYSPLGGWHLMINGNGNHPKEAADFLNWLYFESDYVADECLVAYQLSPLVSADKNLDALYVDTKFSLAYDLINAGKISCRAELAFDSQVLEAIGEMLSGVIYESSTDEEALAYVQTFIDTVGAGVVEK
mgnify:CR=1 FL=1